jgi:predicted ArsR family transcriptional regulator
MQLLDELARTYGDRELRAVLRRIGRRLAEATPLPRAQTRGHTRAARAVEFLCTRGYAARLEKSKGEWLIRIYHCPYQNVMHYQRAVCELDLALIGALVQTSLKMTHCLARQEAECVFVLQPVARRK